MGHGDGAHTHGGGGFDPMPILVIIGALVVAGPVAAAVAELLHLLVIVLVVLVAVVAAGGLALVAFRVSHRRQETARVLYRVTPAPPRSAAVPSQPRSAVEAPRAEVHVHHHWHGTDPADVAAILARDHLPGGPS
jgi:hypothetical protein